MGRLGHLFKTRTRPFMGVDISAARVKLLELDGRPNACRVVSYASEALPVDAVADHQILKPDVVAAALARAKKRSGSNTRDAAIAVSGPGVISKIIDMPADMSDADMEQQIAFDAEHYIPHPIEEVNLDFQVLERDPDNSDTNRVLLIACRRDTIEMRIGALEMAGMTARLVDIEAYALQNACTLLVEQIPELAGDATTAVFDIGADRTRLNIEHAGRSVYSRDIGFGGHDLAADLLARFELADIDQLRARLRTGEIDAAAIAGEINGFAQRVARQIERALQFYISASAIDEVIDRILLVGSSTLYPGFESAMHACLDRPLTIGNPLAGMLASTAARRNHVDIEGPALMVAAGLAMRAIR